MRGGIKKVNKWLMSFPATKKSRLPAIGGGYASEGNAIGEKYWTFHAMDSTLKVSIMEGSQRSHRSHSRVIQGGTLRTTAIGHIDISGLCQREVTWSTV